MCEITFMLESPKKSFAFKRDLANEIMNINDINKLLKNGDASALRSALSESDRLLLERLMSDSAARADFLSSKEAQQILEMLKKTDKG